MAALFLQFVEPFLQPCEQCLQHQNRRDRHISVNIAPRTKLQKTKVVYFSILMNIFFIYVCPWSHIYRDKLPSRWFWGWRHSSQGWRNGSTSWRNSAAMLETKVHQAETATAAVFSTKQKTLAAEISPTISRVKKRSKPGNPVHWTQSSKLGPI